MEDRVPNPSIGFYLTTAFDYEIRNRLDIDIATLQDIDELSIVEGPEPAPAGGAPSSSDATMRTGSASTSNTQAVGDKQVREKWRLLLCMHVICLGCSPNAPPLMHAVCRPRPPEDPLVSPGAVRLPGGGGR